MSIVWEDLTVDEFLYVVSHVKQPLAVIMDQPGARTAAAKKLGDPDTWELSSRSRRSPQEIRGDGGGHSFHGNQYTGGKGGGGYSSMAVLGNVVVPAGGPTTAKEYAKALRDKGYTGPLSYPKGKLKEIYDVHVGSAPKGTPGTTTTVSPGHAGTGSVKGMTSAEMTAQAVAAAKAKGSTTGGYVKTSLTGDLANHPVGTVKVTKAGTAWENTGTGFKKLGPEHPLTGSKPGIYKKGGTDAPAASKVAASHAGVEYSHKAISSSDTPVGSIKVSPTGMVSYKGTDGWVTAGPGTTAAFGGKKSGTYEPIGGTIKGAGAKVPNASGSHLPGGTPITTSVKKLAHEVEASQSHAIGTDAHKASKDALTAAKKKVSDAHSMLDKPYKEVFNGSNALHSYQGMGSSSINKSMNTGHPNGPARDMKTLMDKHGPVITQKLTVDRGIQGAHAQQVRDLKPGTVFEYKNFVSTTYNQFNPSISNSSHAQSVAAGFGHSYDVSGSGAGSHTTVMRITVPKGVKYLHGTDGEKELILAPGKFKVSHVSTGTHTAGYLGKTQPFTIIHMTYEV